MSKKSNGFGKFLAGAAIGAGLGVLFAPKSGSETRKELKIKLDELMRKIKNIDLEDVKVEVENKIDDIKAALTDLDGEKVLDIAKKKAKDIKKMVDDLVDIAIKKGTPVIKKTADDVRVKTIKVLEETIKKLEGNTEKAKSKKN